MKDFKKLVKIIAISMFLFVTVLNLSTIFGFNNNQKVYADIIQYEGWDVYDWEAQAYHCDKTDFFERDCKPVSAYHKY